MSVAKSDSGTPNISGGVVTTIDLTTFSVSAGSNLVLIGFLHTNGNVSGTSMRWDPTGTNQAMTSITSQLNTVRIEAFVLINPTVGNLVLRAAWTTGRRPVIGAICFSGAHQTTPIVAADTVTATGSSNAPSTGPVTSSSDGVTVGCNTFAGSNTNSTTTQTSIYRDNTQVPSVASYGLGGSSNTHTWGCTTSAAWAAIGLHIAAASGLIVVPQIMNSCRQRF